MSRTVHIIIGVVVFVAAIGASFYGGILFGEGGGRANQAHRGDAFYRDRIGREHARARRRGPS